MANHLHIFKSLQNPYPVLKVKKLITQRCVIVIASRDYASLITLYQTQKARLAVSNSFSLQGVVLALIFLATLIFVNDIGLFLELLLFKLYRRIIFDCT